MTRLLFLLGVLLASTGASAGPITASASGCVQSLPSGASWVASEGFVFMAFYSLTAGCEPTLEIPTGGFHEASVTLDGGYRVQVLKGLLPSCGRVQFDAHAYSATGLDPFGLTALVFDTGRDCVAPMHLSLKPQALGNVYSSQTSGGSSGGTVTEIPPYTPPYVPPGGAPVPVPDQSSSLLLLACGLIALRWVA